MVLISCWILFHFVFPVWFVLYMLKLILLVVLVMAGTQIYFNGCLLIFILVYQFFGHVIYLWYWVSFQAKHYKKLFVFFSADHWYMQILFNHICFTDAIFYFFLCLFKIQKVQGMHSDAAKLKKASIWREASRIVGEEGFRAFWKGNLVTIAHRLPYSSVNFYAYEHYKKVDMNIMWMTTFYAVKKKVQFCMFLILTS